MTTLLGKYSNLVLAIILCLVIVCIPFLQSDTVYNGTQSAKFFVFTIAVLMICPVFLVNAFLRKRLQINKIDISFISLLFYVIVNRELLQGVHSFGLNYFEMLGLAVFYAYLRILHSKYYLFLLISVTIAISIEALYGNLQKLGYYFSNNSDFQITGNFFNPGPFAGYLCIGLPLLLGLWIIAFCHYNNRWGILFKRKRVLILSSFVCCLLGADIIAALLAAESRAAWLGSITGVVYLSLANYGVTIRQKIKMNTPAILFIFPILLLLSAAILLKSYQFKKDSADNRILMNQTSLLMLKSHPVTGVGFDRYRVHFMQYQAKVLKYLPNEEKYKFTGDNDCAFNELAQFTVENGFVGLVILILFATLIIRVILKVHNNLLLLACAGILSIVILSLFSYPTQILPIKINFLLCIAIVASFDNMYVVDLGLRRAFLLAVACLYPLIVYKGTSYLVKLFKAYRDWESGYAIMQSGEFRSALKYYKNCRNSLLGNATFLEEYGYVLKNCGSYTAAIDVLKLSDSNYTCSKVQMDLGDCYKQVALYDAAEEAYNSARAMAPGLIYPQHALMQLYIVTKKPQKALMLANKILAVKVKVRSPEYKEMCDDAADLIKKNQPHE